MMPGPDPAGLITYTEARGGKVILAGDTSQLQAVENGGGMSLPAGALGYARLAEPIRFRNRWEQQASLRLRDGDTTVLTEYDQHARITGGDPEQMMDAAAKAYVALTASGTDTLLMAAGHALRRELSRRIRDDLITLGAVQPGPAVTIADGTQASPGDLIIATRNDHTAEAGEPGRTLANGDLLRRERENVFADVMADRADWEAATRTQRHLAVAADAEMRRRHLEQRFTPLRSAEPQAATDAERAELTLTAGQDIPEAGQWIKDLAPARRAFADKLAERQSLTVPSEDPDYGDLGQAFPSWTGPSKGAILQPPKPEIRPSARSWSAPWTATPTWKRRIDSSPIHPRSGEVTAMAAIGITGMGLTGVVRMNWVRDDLAHVLEHARTDETSGTWTGRACPEYGLALGSDVDGTTLRRLAAEGAIADLTWEAPDDIAADHGQVFQAAIAAYQAAEPRPAEELWDKVRAIWSQAWSANFAALEFLQDTGLSRFSACKPQRWLAASFEHHCGQHGLPRPHIHNIVVVALTRGA